MITNINRAAYKKIMYGHFFHAIFLATIMNTMIRPAHHGGGYGRRFNHDLLDLRILRFTYQIKAIFKSEESWFRQLSNIYVISISHLGH